MGRGLRQCAAWGATLACQAVLAAAEDYLGAAACAECHAPLYEKQRATRHAMALRPIAETPLAGLLAARPVEERGGASFRYETSPAGVVVTARKGEQEAEAKLEWAFGAGAQGFTPVGRIEGRFIEHRISYYTRAGRAALTPGHPTGPSPDARAALGLEQDRKTIYRCFNCHATGVQPGPAGPDLSRMRAGVECERCHGPGRAHVEAARAGQPAAQLARSVLHPGKFPAKAVVEICAECHRTPPAGPPVATPEADDPISVRFQPIGLLASRCFQRSRKLSCLTCHDPHEDARPRDDPSYTQKCLGCHASPVRAGARCRRTARQNCLPCHMKTAEPAPFLHFTDHRIRVYRGVGD